MIRFDVDRFMGGLNSLDGLWVDWIFRGCLADGGQADTLIYKTHTRTRMCMYFSERMSARPPGLPVSFYIPIDFDFIQRVFMCDGMGTPTYYAGVNMPPFSIFHFPFSIYLSPFRGAGGFLFSIFNYLLLVRIGARGVGVRKI